MKKTLPLVALLLAGPASAAAPSFEGALTGLRQAVLATRAAQVQAKDDRTLQDLRQLGRDTERQGWDARRLRDRLSDLRRRTGRMRPTPGQRPGQPGDQQDPFFRWDLQRVVDDLRDLARRLQDDQRTLDRVIRDATKDPVLVGPAQDLVRGAQSLESEAGWLSSEARWAGMDLRRIGYTFEAWDVERGAEDAARYCGDLTRDARRLLGQVQ